MPKRRIRTRRAVGRSLRPRAPGRTAPGLRHSGGRAALVTAVDRAARVLAALSQSSDFLTLPEVAKLAGLSKPTAFRILMTLMSEGLIFQNEANATYGFGFQVLRLADVVLGTLPFAALARGIMREINGKLNETVVLSVRQGPHCYFVHSVDTTQSIGQTHTLGLPAPLHTVAPGRAMLAALPDAELHGYLQRCRRLDRKLRPAELAREIKRVRVQGFAGSSGELRHSGHSIAMAIPLQGIGAALHISIPGGRYTAELQQRCIEALRNGAAAIVAERIKAAPVHNMSGKEYCRPDRVSRSRQPC
jgi:DNA-binding IclR family transcriptional regulator